MCMQHRSTQIDKAKINRAKSRNKQQYNNNWGLQYPTFNNEYIIQTENQY